MQAARRALAVTLSVAGAAHLAAAAGPGASSRARSSAAPDATIARGAPGARGASADPVTLADTLRLYYVGHAIGEERYTLTSSTDGLTLASDFDYRDRGRRTHVTSELRMGPDFAPRHLAVTRLTDTSATVETLVDVRGRAAMVVARGDSSRVTLPARAFVIAGTTPTTQHLALVRYWLAHGRPPTLSVVPGGPLNDVTIERRGRDTLEVNGRSMVLDRYAVDGVVWGRECVWLDGAGRMAALTTAGGGGLTLEAVRLELEPLYPRLVAIATRDRMEDLARLSRRVPPIARGTIALTGATLVDGTGRPAIPDATVVVADGRIVAAGASGDVTIPPGARRIDARGRTIVPGLWDMHAHVMQGEWAPVYLASGVTMVRDMGNELELVTTLRDALAGDTLAGPRLVLAGLIDGPGPDAFGPVSTGTAEEGRVAVRRYHERGFAQVKLYTLLAPDVVAAIAREAHRLGMTVTGHVPASLTVSAAVDSGMDHIAHLPIRGEAASDSVRQVVERLRAHGTVMDPTASWGEILQHSRDQPVASFQPGIAHLPPVLAQRIGAMGVRGLDTAVAHARLARTLGVIRALHEAGVPIVAGTDEGVPGFSVYREIELYVQAGMTPMDALRAATAVSARAMRMDGEVGTIEVGKRADLLVLDRNPLERIENIRTVRLVMRGGALYRSADLWRVAGFR